MESELQPLSKHLVSWSISVLGRAFQEEYGKKTFLKIDKIRLQMKKMRRPGPGNPKKANSILLRDHQEFDQMDQGFWPLKTKIIHFFAKLLLGMLTTE